MWEHFWYIFSRCLDWLSCHIFVLVCVYIDITYSVTSIWRIESSCEWRSNHTVYTYCVLVVADVYFIEHLYQPFPTLTIAPTHALDSENVPLIRSKFAYCVLTTPLVKSCASSLFKLLCRSLIYKYFKICLYRQHFYWYRVELYQLTLQENSPYQVQ